MKKLTTQHNLKLFTKIVLVFFALLAMSNTYGDELKTAEGTGVVTTTLTDTYEDVASATVNLGASNNVVNKVLVVSTFSVEALTNNDRTATFRLVDVANTVYTSGIIRSMERDKGGDKGIGSLVYIFDVSGNSGDVTFKLQQKTSNNSYNNTTSGTIVAVALSPTNSSGENPNGNHLNADLKTLTTAIGAGVGTYTTALTTVSLNLPVSGEFFIAASINNQSGSGGTHVGTWKLQQQKDGGTWTDIGIPISRSISKTGDDGIASLGLMVTNLSAGDYSFRLQHKSEAVQSIETLNTNLVAVALAYDDATNGGRTFPAFSKENTTGTTSAIDSFNNVESESGTPASNTDMLFYAQYNMTANAGLNAPYFDMHITDGDAFNYSSQTQQRRLSDASDFGAGGSVGLATGLSTGTSYTASIRHQSDGSVSLTTYNVILSGFQTDDYPAEGYWKGGDSGNETQWNNTANWGNGVIPTSSTNVSLYDKTYDPVISADADCKNLYVDEVATLTIESTSSGTGSLIVAETSSGNVTVQRFIASDAWHLVSPSTTDIQNDNFYIDETHDAWLTMFNEADGDGSAGNEGGWEFLTNLGTSLSLGTGYSYFVNGTSPTNDNTVAFTGNLQLADLSPTITWADANHGFNLIGNPFSSAVYWDNTWSLSNVQATIWIWNEASSNYSSFTAATTYNIPVGQGFFVRATSSSPTITIPVAKRVHNSQAFLKSTAESAYTNQLRLRANNNQFWDEVKISFQDNGTEGFDNGWDASKMFGSTDAPQLYLVEQERRQSYNHLPLLAEGEERTVAMSYVPGVEGNQSITADFEYFHDADVIIEDLLTGVSQDLKLHTVYTFNGSKDDSPDRFLLHFAWSPDDIGEDFEQASDIHIYSYGKDIYIRSSQEAINQNGNVFVYDLMGRELANYNIVGTELFKIQINTNNNYVVVKVVKDGSIKTQKVYIN